MKKTKAFISLFLSLVMVLSLAIPTFAAGLGDLFGDLLLGFFKHVHLSADYVQFHGVSSLFCGFSLPSASHRDHTRHGADRPAV